MTSERRTEPTNTNEGEPPIRERVQKLREQTEELSRTLDRVKETLQSAKKDEEQ